MGCCKSQAATEPEFRDAYTLGKFLGEGAHAVVHECTQKKSQKIFAVKLQELWGSDMAMQEVGMLKRLKGHSNVVEIEDYYQDDVFCYVVLEKFDGGDLVDVLQTHMKKKGKVTDSMLRPLFKQMLDAVKHLHDHQIIHRDVKADNFLLDRPDILHKDCRVVLTDLGTAVELKPNGFLDQQVGTMLYWSPEVVRKRYSYPSDLWAIGVILFSILIGYFPFKNAEGILEHEPDYSKNKTLSPEVLSFLKQTLTKQPDQRMTAQSALQHRWISTTSTNGQQKEDSSAAESGISDMQDIHVTVLAHPEVAKRREDLLKQVNEGGTSKAKGGKGKAKAKADTSSSFDDKPFTTTEADGTKFFWEWWEPSKLGGQLGSKRGVGKKVDSSAMEKMEMSCSPSVIKENFEKYGIDCSKYGVGQANTLKQISRELVKGECVLMKDGAQGDRLVRAVDVVLLRLKEKTSSDACLLIESALEFEDGRKKDTNRLPGTKKRPHESLKATAKRLLSSYLHMPDVAVKFPEEGVKETIEEEKESPAYPGLQTIYRKHIFECYIGTQDATVLSEIGLGSATKAPFKIKSTMGDVRTWTWVTQEQAAKQGIAVAGGGSSKYSGLEVVSPAGQWTEESMKKQLVDAKVDTSKYGTGKALTVKQLADEMKKGESYLMESSGRLLRIIDVVVVRMRTPNFKVLVETQHTLTDGREIITNRLPATKRRQGENVWGTARRLVEGKLRMLDDDVNIREGFEDFEEEEKESDAYPGLPSIYRKHYIDASVGDKMDKYADEND